MSILRARFYCPQILHDRLPASGFRVRRGADVPRTRGNVRWSAERCLPGVRYRLHDALRLLLPPVGRLLVEHRPLRHPRLRRLPHHHHPERSAKAERQVLSGGIFCSLV